MKSSEILLSLQYAQLKVSKEGTEIRVRYENSEISDGTFLYSVFGSGTDFESACDDYLNKIRGKKLVIDADLEHRKEVTILG